MQSGSLTSRPLKYVAYPGQLRVTPKISVVETAKQKGGQHKIVKTGVRAISYGTRMAPRVSYSLNSSCEKKFKTFLFVTI